MTTIAWDGKTLAADSQSTSGSMISSLRERKIYHPPIPTAWKLNGQDVRAIGVSGDCGSELVLIDCLKEGMTYKAEMPEVYGFTAMVITDDRQCYLIFKSEGKKQATVCLQPNQYAIGSGNEIARTAMALGKTAQEAVQVACELDVYSGGDVVTFTI
ncbi:hypothetical protein I5398_11830 [Citrobacter freundii]|uniref:hypothetical protein n=1 Tax=Citrobacter TaxID=544 RepID=UPI001DDFFF1C|nr:hypothetical protein [Citrobacter sp. Cpo035]MBJ8796719.1 hypothetical protein [Citrobacter freundii]MDM2915081.1 hypothetical protein [Citrobacter sp. Cpo035]